MRKILLILIMSLFALTACTTAGDNEVADALALPQNYSAQIANGSISLNYPADWVVAGEFVDLGLTIATSAELASNTAFDGTVADGEVYIQIAFAPESLLEQDTPAAVLQAIVDTVGDTEGTISEIETRTLNGKVAAFVTLDAEDSSDGMFLVIDSGDAYSTVVVAVPDGDVSDYQATVEAIAGSIEYVLNAAEATPEMTADAETTPEMTAEAEITPEMTAEATEESE